MPLMRIPYTTPLPAPTIKPATAISIPGAVHALTNFLVPPNTTTTPGKTLVLSGAGISVASGLADYRGHNGTYTLNKTYRPIYFHEFAASHEARKRYWARSFLGWTTLQRSQPNAAHHAVAALGPRALGLVGTVITQNVDSFHPRSHPELPTLELHGYLRNTVCLTCRTEYDREQFQADLAALNPDWAAFLRDMLDSGALSTEDPAERRRRGLKTNPDGDVDVPGVEYGTFRYPPCPHCLATHPSSVATDADGAWHPSSSATGILKPAVIMFGESIPHPVKLAVERAVDQADRVLVLGSSLATYSAWRLIKRAVQQHKPLAAINMGGLRGEDLFFDPLPAGPDADGSDGVRCSLPLEEIMPALVEHLRDRDRAAAATRSADPPNFVPAPWASL